MYLSHYEASSLEREVDGAASEGSEELTEPESEDASPWIESTLIAKPPGEVGRPGRGGYNLRRVLSEHGWDQKTYKFKRVIPLSLKCCTCISTEI